MIKIFSIIILTIFFVSKANAEPNALLAEAIKYNLSINDNLPTINDIKNGIKDWLKNLL